ncbi:hypothetical protein [Pseudoxanthomonas sp. UTMC 1351]|uniref:hypothetical protein n=1 Tax=Pseudoxanthomonas sp. UTMC 1351 TaxID=2695853 RepID=UPI0034CDE01E
MRPTTSLSTTNAAASKHASANVGVRTSPANGSFAGNRTLRYLVDKDITDTQVSYAFSDSSSLAGLSSLFQISNLTSEAYQTYAEAKDRPLEHIERGGVLIC